MNLKNLEIENPNKINVLIIHGTLDGSSMEERQYNPISKKVLEEKGFDYVALGHIHKNNFTQDGKIIYPGSTISLGFDELGEHGMVTGEITKEKSHLEFIKLDDTEFIEKELECDSIQSVEELIEKVNNIKIEENRLYKIILTGKRNFEINVYDLYKYELNDRIIKIKDKTKPNYDLEKIAREHTLRGLFVKEIIEEMQKQDYDEETIEKALEVGMEILE